VFFVVYKITNKINGKYYIGMHKTTDINDGYMGSGTLIRRAIAKYGVDSFVKEILHVFNNEKDMIEKEKELVVVSEETYNLMSGGRGGFGHINENGLSDYSKAGKAAGALAAKRFREGDYRGSHFWFVSEGQKIRSEMGLKVIKEKYPNGTFYGKSHTEEYKQKMSLIMKEKQSGEKNSQYGTCWINNGQQNKKIKKEDLDNWLELGYNKGRIMI
jgi:hypothetical protein